MSARHLRPRGSLEAFVRSFSMAVEKKDLDWGNLTFDYQPTDYSYVCN